MFDLWGRTQVNCRSRTVIASHWLVLWQSLRRTSAAFRNMAVSWPITATMILLLQMSLTRKSPTEKHLLAIGWPAGLLFFVIGPSGRGVCDCETALLFGIWALPMVVEVELREAPLGILCAAPGCVCGRWLQPSVAALLRQMTWNLSI
jgi:hypothetical protein